MLSDANVTFLEDGVRPIYNLMNPEIHCKNQAIVERVANSVTKKEPVYYPTGPKKDMKRTEGKSLSWLYQKNY